MSFMAPMTKKTRSCVNVLWQNISALQQREDPSDLACCGHGWETGTCVLGDATASNLQLSGVNSGLLHPGKTHQPTHSNLGHILLGFFLSDNACLWCCFLHCRWQTAENCTLSLWMRTGRFDITVCSVVLLTSSPSNSVGPCPNQLSGPGKWKKKHT